MTRLVSENFFYQIFEDNFQGTPVRFYRHKFSGAVTINANDCAHVLGYDSMNEFLGTDDGLDSINNWKRDHPYKPVFGDNGSGAMFEEILVI